MNANLRPVRGSRLVISIEKTATAAVVLSAAVAKFAAHDWHFQSTDVWVLRYPDGKPVDKLPEGSEDFRLDLYKEQLMKEYQRITLYISCDGELLLFLR